MAAAKDHSRKGRKRHISSFFCFSGGCFGNPKKVSAEHGDGKWVKNVSINSGMHGRTLPATNQKIQMSSSQSNVNSSKEIHVVGDKKRSQNLAPSADDEIISNKTHNIISEKCRNKEESNPTIWVNKQNNIGQATWTKLTKMSHSVSLPLACHRKKKSSTAADDGYNKGITGRELKVGGEFDSMVGAVIIMITLVVMLIWGKVCAILSTAAWLYFIPRFRANMDNYHASTVIKIKNGENNVDLDSWEYKKNVVLQGLLDRNQHL